VCCPTVVGVIVAVVDDDSAAVDALDPFRLPFSDKVGLLRVISVVIR
jgi:hypothetical protein